MRSATPIVRPLSGGVSSEILYVEDGDRACVVKRALAKLKVRDDWFADTSRSRSELAYLKFADRIVPGAVPRVIFAPPSGEWFAMEFLGAGFANWKALLLAGRAEAEHAHRAGAVLGRIHGATWGDPEMARQFATLENFRQLRLDPYLTTTARRVPELSELILAVEENLANTALALVHGDFSPKNILISAERLVLLDAEVAWFGDPAFDVAFLLTHLHLKSLVHKSNPEPCLKSVAEFWSAYSAALGAHADAALEERSVRVLLCLLLARVHGKSPVEYLNASQQTLVSDFVRAQLPRAPKTLAAFTASWRQSVLS